MNRTRQEIFDLAWNGLKAQGFGKSRVPGKARCLYRGPDGLKCAIGHCIPDGNYRKKFDRGMELGGVLHAARISDADYDFARGLQEAHDFAAAPADMVARLCAFAVAHSLIIPS